MTRQASEAKPAGLRDCAALFDLDGTLIDSWQIARQAFCFAYQRATSLDDPPVYEFEARLGVPFPQILRELDLPARMHEYFMEYSQAHAHSIQLFEGVLPALATLHAAGVRLGVVTGKDRGRSEYLLEITGLNTYIDALVTPDDAPGKPDPACMYECLKRLRCSTSLAAYIGDSLADMQCGKRATILRVFAKWGALQELDSTEYDFVADEPRQASEIFLEWTHSERKRRPEVPSVVAC